MYNYKYFSRKSLHTSESFGYFEVSINILLPTKYFFLIKIYSKFWFYSEACKICLFFFTERVDNLEKKVEKCSGNIFLHFKNIFIKKVNHMNFFTLFCIFTSKDELLVIQVLISKEKISIDNWQYTI